MLLCCVCFFFKQKTAYEMRISDWSSDVCSSDLRKAIERAVLDAAILEVEGGEVGDHDPIFVAGTGWHPGAIGIVASRLKERYHRPALVEIGRASCRERVCQYV